MFSQKLHIPCSTELWLGYEWSNNIFLSVKGTPNYFKWGDEYPQNFPGESFISASWGGNFWQNTNSISLNNFLCQCKPGTVYTLNTKMIYELLIIILLQEIVEKMSNQTTFKNF